MTDYTITTNFGAKDSLPSGNAGKVIKGSEFTTEFTNIQTAVNTKADTTGDTFTGVVNFSDDIAVNTNTLFVDVSEAKVGIGTTSPSSKLEIVGGNSGTDVDVLRVAGSNSALNVTCSDLSVNNPVWTLRTFTGEALAFGDGTDENMRIDSSGKVGIGTTSPAQALHVIGKIRLESNFPTIEFVDTDNNPDFTISGGNGSVGFFDETNSVHRFLVDSSGNVLVGTTSATAMGTTNTGVVLRDNDSSYFARNSNGTIIAFFSGLGGAGSISLTGNTANYNTTSDERLKENIADSTDAGSKIDAIQIRQFDWKADGSHQDYGVIAQELVEVAPEAVHQPVDEEDKMGVDYSKLVPMLIKEVQSLRSRVAELESE